MSLGSHHSWHNRAHESHYWGGIEWKNTSLTTAHFLECLFTCKLCKTTSSRNSPRSLWLVYYSEKVGGDFSCCGHKQGFWPLVLVRVQHPFILSSWQWDTGSLWLISLLILFPGSRYIWLSTAVTVSEFPLFSIYISPFYSEEFVIHTRLRDSLIENTEDTENSVTGSVHFVQWFLMLNLSVWDLCGLLVQRIT